VVSPTMRYPRSRAVHQHAAQRMEPAIGRRARHLGRESVLV
jgi:hypothetical protein